MDTGAQHIGQGEPMDVVAMTPGISTSTLELSAEEWMLLAQMGREAVLGELLARSSFPEEQTSQLLWRLAARGVVHFVPARADLAAPAARPAQGASTARPGQGASTARPGQGAITSPPGEGATLHFGSASTLTPPPPAASTVAPGPDPEPLRGASSTLCFAGAGGLGSAPAASSSAGPRRSTPPGIPAHLRHLEGLGFADTLLRPPQPAPPGADAGVPDAVSPDEVYPDAVFPDSVFPDAVSPGHVAPRGDAAPGFSAGSPAALVAPRLQVPSLPTPEPVSSPPIATPMPEQAATHASGAAVAGSPAGPREVWPPFEAEHAQRGPVGQPSPATELPFTPPPPLDRERLRGLRAPVPASAPEQSSPTFDPALLVELEELEARAASGDLFRLLGLARGADAAEVKRAFHAASRRLHPDRFFHLGPSEEKQRLEQVFRHLSEAHATLSDPRRRGPWEAANPQLAARPSPRTPTPLPRAWDAEERDAERRDRFAQHPYLAKAARLRGGVAQGRALLAAGDFQGAVETLSAARALEPGNAELASLLTEARERHAASIASREEAAGRAAEARGDLASALESYRRAATLDVRNASVAFRAASLLQKQGGDSREARLFAQRAVELCPDQAEYHHLLAQTLIANGSRKLARRHLEEVLRLDPRHASARGQLLQLRIGL